MDEEQKKAAIKKLFDAVVKPTDSDAWRDEARRYHEDVKEFAQKASPTDPEKEWFFEKFLYKKNGTAGLGQSASFSTEKRPQNVAEILGLLPNAKTPSLTRSS